MDRDRRHAKIVTRPLRPEPGVTGKFDDPVAHETDIEGAAAGITDDHVTRELFRTALGQPPNGKGRKHLPCGGRVSAVLQ